MESTQIPVVNHQLNEAERTRQERTMRHASILPTRAYDPTPGVKSFDELPAVKRARKQLDEPIIPLALMCDLSPANADIARDLIRAQQHDVMGVIERDQEYWCREATATNKPSATLQCSVLSAMAIAIRDVVDRCMEEIDESQQ